MINNYYYTTNDKLLKQKLEDQTLPVPFTVLMMSAKTLTNTAKLVYSLMRYRLQLSVKHPYKYFDRMDHFYFVNFKIAELEYITGTGKKAIRHGIAQLDNLGLIVKHKPQYFKRSPRFELPKVPKGTYESVEKEHVKRNNTRTNRTGKTVNTKTGEIQRKFKTASTTDLWTNSAKKMGLTLDTINLIAEFSNTYSQSAYRITHFIAEARDIVANKYHVNKHDRRFEINQNIIDHLTKKLKILFSHITSKDDHKAKLSNYAGFLINSLKRFFKWTFGKGRDETVKPKTNNRHFNNYRKRKPIKEDIPQSMKDDQSGKVMPKKANKLLTKLNKTRNTYDTLVIQADDPVKPNPDHGKMVIAKEQRDHYQKLYDTKQKVFKPTPKPKEQTKQPKGLHKTSKALHDKIQARLRNLGEN